jgi:hypothetical protein
MGAPLGSIFNHREWHKYDDLALMTNSTLLQSFEEAILAYLHVCARNQPKCTALCGHKHNKI